MLNWVNSHGLEAMGLYVLFLLIAGTVPPLPADAGFLATWVYLIVKAISVNGRGIGNAMGIKIPELQLANIPGMKTAQGQTRMNEEATDKAVGKAVDAIQTEVADKQQITNSPTETK